MDISSIISQSALLGVPNPSAPISKKGDLSTNSSSVSVSSTSQTTPQAQMPSVRSNMDYVQQQLNALIEDDPPWFPAGSPQRIDTIKAMKCVLDEVKSSSMPDEVKKQSSRIKLTDKATDSDMSALDAISQLKDNVISNGTTVSVNGQSGNVINIKV